MIELRTGVPGSGKSLSMVHELARLVARWGKHAEEARPIFVHNIKDLALPHSVMPLKQWEESRGVFRMVPDWDAIPDGALCLFDECQDLFPPRSSQSRPPEHIAFLNTHRHKGLDLWITTQHPKLIDVAVRALVGKHQHFRRVFGGARSIIYEWDMSNDSLANFKSAIKSYFPFPRDSFKYYKSAEIHTKQKFKLPLWFGLPFLALALGAYFVPRAYGVLTHGVSGKALGDRPSIGAGGVSAAPLPASVPVAASAPVVGGAVQLAGGGVYVPPPVVPAVRPKVGACVASATACKCYSPSGAVVELPELVCRKNSEGITAEYAVEPVQWAPPPPGVPR